MKVISCGPCVRSKGIEFAADVVSRVGSDISLDWYGITSNSLHDAHLWEKLMSSAVVQDNQMRLFPWSDNLSEKLQEYDLYVNFSVEFDSLPTIVMEAIMEGLVVICGDVGGAKEMIPSDLLQDLVYKSADQLDCFAKIEQFNNTDGHYRSKVVQRLREHQKRNFNFEIQSNILWKYLIA